MTDIREAIDLFHELMFKEIIESDICSAAKEQLKDSLEDVYETTLKTAGLEPDS